MLKMLLQVSYSINNSRKTHAEGESLWRSKTFVNLIEMKKTKMSPPIRNNKALCIDYF